ncbi:hypothetical protein [Anaerotignum sp. MB30-C6]|uniref:hypothetical protein n=1 Tax=Anaerotignum sp. MB30-C6 TaxID=3070814 RepID=UPI0027DB98D0|nr:hypothetical protein [Anaerotignum sp. MB30-C6]WMI82267.1 hypothetical protein RBQ60_05895 [Anaerotignum sp. MB30-C6]
MKKGFNLIKDYALSLCLFFSVGGFVIFGLYGAKTAQKEEALRIAQESIMRAAISCYALEGVYPPSYEYLKENYGIQIDEEKYTVFYDIFASNMMPDVTVTEK